MPLTQSKPLGGLGWTPVSADCFQGTVGQRAFSFPIVFSALGTKSGNGGCSELFYVFAVLRCCLTTGRPTLPKPETHRMFLGFGTGLKGPKNPDKSHIFRGFFVFLYFCVFFMKRVLTGGFRWCRLME
jgi:hypothetical protein